MDYYVNLFIQSIFVENLALAFFLGMCTFLAVSKNINTAFGLGMTVLVVMVIAIPLNNLIYRHILRPDSTFLGEFDLSFLDFIIYIGVLAALVQVMEMVLDKHFPALHQALGIYLPLLTVHCAIFGGVIFMAQRDYDFIESLVYGAGSGLGWLLAIVAIAGLRQKMKYSDVPEGLRGIGITFIVAGLMSLGFMSFPGSRSERRLTMA
ncbi:NADH:ubiquinone reductase (Na(+)-transporting) subunit E [Aeromonas media]|uniref:NADH:ubiquinone reductase (Na(+)-transporting) subunit E n=1 Tax=Aeromonas media TaxID=651 RepID=UPI00227FF46D|nr:NADH:ubiquinone reductase (Na(+)-transporting) subunit E [Aeromonas media]MCY9820965.1 NADH:ubiquinone reductase (Na(+)-transporting) subunit E [Aeromonas media]